MLPISFFVNRKLKATHETSEGTYQFFFSFGDIRKQKQNKTKKPSIIVDESGIARTTQITQVIILAQVRFVWKCCSHQSNYTSRVCFPDCGIVAFPTSTIELMPTFEGNLFCCVKNKKAISLSKFT